MGVREEHATRRETIDVRCVRLWVPAKTANPVIQVVHRNQQDIGAGLLGTSFLDEEYCKEGNCDRSNGPDYSSGIHIYFFLRGADTKGMAVLLISDSHPSSRSLMPRIHVARRRLDPPVRSGRVSG